jgi:hypothetical protein
MVYKRLSILMLIVLCAACKKGQQTSACGTQVCTTLFTYVTAVFVDKNNMPVNFTNFTEVNLRTNKTMTHTYPPAVDFVAGTVIIADDSDLKDLSSSGDTLKVTATNSATGQTETALFKVSGGTCNCHVTKVSGPDKVVFDQ